MPEISAQWFALFSITLFSYFIKGMTGFGNTLVMNSLLSFFKENRFITPIDLLLGIPANIILAWKNRGSIDPGVVIPLSIAVILGNMPGIFFLNFGNELILKIFLGFVLLILGFDMLDTGVLHRIKFGGEGKTLYFSGFISGVLMGLFGVGAFLAAIINRSSNDRHSFRGNLCCIFLVDNFFRLIGYSFQKIINPEILYSTIILVLPALGGLFISSKIDRRINEGNIKKIVVILLIGSGAALIINNIYLLNQSP